MIVMSLNDTAAEFSNTMDFKVSLATITNTIIHASTVVTPTTPTTTTTSATTTTTNTATTANATTAAITTTAAATTTAATTTAVSTYACFSNIYTSNSNLFLVSLLFKTIVELSKSIIRIGPMGWLKHEVEIVAQELTTYAQVNCMLGIYSFFTDIAGADNWKYVHLCIVSYEDIYIYTV